MIFWAYLYAITPITKWAVEIEKEENEEKERFYRYEKDWN